MRGGRRRLSAVAQTSRALAARINRAVATGTHLWLYHHPDDRPLDGLRVGPRQRWTTEQATRDDDGRGTVRARGLYVKRPVPPVALPSDPPAPAGVPDGSA